jgi:hypothetical protein
MAPRVRECPLMEGECSLDLLTHRLDHLEAEQGKQHRYLYGEDGDASVVLQLARLHDAVARCEQFRHRLWTFFLPLALLWMGAIGTYVWQAILVTQKLPK